MAGRFHWHRQARLFGPDGTEVSRRTPGPSVIPPDPGPEALALALAATGPFRIGLPGAPAPAPGPVPMFETLTSGSTGTPRRIRRRQASWTASFAVNAGLFGLGPGARIAVAGGLDQSLALYGAVEGMHLGAEVHLLAGLRPDRQAQALAAQRIEVLYATPAQLRALCGGSSCASLVLADLRLVLVGGAKLDERLRASVVAIAPTAAVREFYGAAEASFITLADDATPDGSVGRAYPGVSLEVREGEVWVKSPYLFEGYASDPGSARRDDGWLCVGEMGQLHDGHLFLLGRKGRMVTVADHNVFPEAIEALMETLPGITRAAVLAEPDAARGHVLYAVAQGDRCQEAAVLAALRSALGPMKAPRRILWRADWPVTASGKTDFVALGDGR